MKNYLAKHGARIADNGFPIIPIIPGEKRPGRFSGGRWSGLLDWPRYCDTPPTDAEIAGWSAWPDGGVGIACGRVIGIDIDVLDAEVACRITNLAYARLGQTPAIRVGKAPKRLLVFRADTPFAGFKQHPIEVIGRGQQFVAFALHPETGRPYEWIDDSPADLDISQLPEITEAMARAFVAEAWELLPAGLRQSRLAAPTNGTAVSIAPGTQELRGTRDAIEAALKWIPNPDLNYDDWVRVGMAIKGAIGEAGEPLFAGWSATSQKDQPPYTARTWAGLQPRSIGAGTIYKLAHDAGWTPGAELILNGALAELAPVGLADRLAAKPREPGGEPTCGPGRAFETAPRASAPEHAPCPLDIDRLDGALRMMVDFNLATAIRPQPWLAIGAALVAIGTLMGRRYRTESNLRSNLYIVAMAASGGGKDHARNVIKEAFLAANLAAHLGGNRLVSGAGLLAALRRKPATLFQIDEFGQFVASIADKRRSPKHLTEIWDLFTELSTSAGSTFFGAEYADQKLKPREDIIQPCCAIHATTVPDTFWQALRGGSLQDGSLARFLVFQTDVDIPDRNRAAKPVSEVPADLVGALKAIAGGVPGFATGNLSGIDAPMITPQPYPVRMNSDAEQLFENLDDEITDRQRRSIGCGHGAVLARIWENTAKVALIKAVSANPLQPVIRREDAAWARDVVAFCVVTLLTQAQRHIAENDTERNNRRVQEIIRAAGPRGITKKCLYDKTRFLTRRDRDDILATLIETEEITFTVEQGGSRPATTYYAVP